MSEVFVQKGNGAVQRTVELKLQESVSVLDFGAVGDTKENSDRSFSIGTDCTQAFKNALAVGNDVFVPAGGYYVKGGLEVLFGCALKGEGRAISQLFIDASYLTSAQSIVKLNHYSEIHDIGFVFYQPDTSSRSNLINYPWAIDFSGSNRVVIDRVRVNSAWNGLNGSGNTGGSYLGFIELGCLNNGLVLDGALDFFHGVKWHFWPFGLTQSSGLMSIWGDGVSSALVVGAVDGFNVENIASFQQKFVFNTNAGAVIPYLIGNMQLDGDNSRLIVQGGVVAIGKVYDTKSSNAQNESIIVQRSGVLDIGYLRVSSDSQNYCCKTYDSALLSVHAGNIHHINAAGGAVFVQGGTALFEDCTMDPAPSTNYNNAYCVNSGGVLKVRGNIWTAKGNGSGFATYSANDNPLNEVRDNEFNGWSFSINGSGRLQGVYAGNKGSGSDYVGADLTGVVRRATFQVNGDANGNASIDTGLSSIHLRVVNAFASYKGNSGEAAKCNVTAIDGSRIYLSAAQGDRPIRVTIEYTDNPFAGW